MPKSVLSTALISASLVFFLTGCGDKAAKAPTSPAHKEDASHKEDHASKGPHGGSLIEIGEEEFHAEMVHDDQAKTVTIYILDGAAKASVPIDATSITINLKHEGRGEQFNLAASPDASDPAGKSSRFVSSEAELVKDLDDEKVEAQLALTISGKPFRAAVEHHHE